MWARIADFFAFALAMRGGIGRLVGFFRWMWLTSIRWRSKAYQAADASAHRQGEREESRRYAPHIEHVFAEQRPR